MNARDRPTPGLLSDIDSIPEILKQPQLPSLDGLRAISILLVIACHVLMSFKTRFSFYYFANLGVQFFFVISGFLITTLLLREKIAKGRISLQKFYLRRCFRILPVAYLYLLLLVVAGVLFGLHLNYVYIASSFGFARNFFTDATGIDHLTTHYWSLAVEEQFYLIFPFLLWKDLRVYIIFLLALLAFSLAIDPLFSLFHFHNDDFYHYVAEPIIEFQGITVGSLTAIALFKWGFPYAALARKALASIGLMAAILAATLYEGPYIDDMNFLKCLLFAAILVINLHHDGNVVFRALNSRIMMLIGVLSYSMYIWQQPFTLGLPMIHKAGFMRNIGQSPMVDLLVTTVMLICLGAVSCLSYFYFERSFLKLRDRFR